MKKSLLLIPLSSLALLALIGCSSISASGNTNDGGIHGDVVIDDTGDEPNVDNTSSFELTSSDGTYTSSGSVYTINSAGTFTASGVLEDGQIIINAPDTAEVVLELNGVSISCDSDSPIKALEADKVEISAKSGTSNLVEDARSEKSSTATDDGTYGEGAINADCDLKLKGSGTLVVRGNYNNGVHTTKDLDIQKETLYVTAVNNAIKGKDSITMISGAVTAISKKGNGLKTENTDVSSSGKQRGTITISGGTLICDSTFDGLDAAYDLVVNEDNEDYLDTKITVKTGKNATYSSNYSSATSAKGLKAANQISIAAGTVGVKATDDAIHANYGDALSNGSTGVGKINISGGTIGVASGDDGLHADNTLTISGGNINITGATEGLESNHIVITGGSTCVYGTDDGVNVSKKINETPTIKISGGFLDVAVSNGDTDGIDSNGNFEMTGGFVVTRGSPNNASNMSTGLDCDGTAKIAGGTLIAFNGLEKTPSIGSGVLYAYYGTTSQGGPGGGGHGGGWPVAASSITFNSGTYTLTGNGFSKTFENSYQYSKFLIYSNELVQGNTYTLSCDGSQVLNWTQSSSSVAIS